MSKWQIENLTGYKPKTTFWDDFEIAEHFGKEAIKETAKRCFNEWRDNYEFLTELVMVINHLAWQRYAEKNKEMTEFYSDLYHEYDQEAIIYLDKTNKEALKYYFKTLD